VSLLTQTPSLADAYGRFAFRRTVIVCLLAAAALLSLVADVMTGPAPIAMSEVWLGLVDPDSLDRARQVILWDIRFPAAMLAICVGAALSLAGAEMQTVLNNPLASPFTLGVSNAATLGAALAIVFGVSVPGLDSTYSVPVCAFVFAAGAAFTVQGLARMQGAAAETIVLFGIAMVFGMNALLSLVQYVASSDAIQQIVFWTMGSLNRATWDKVGIVAAALLLVLPLSLRGVWAMTALRAGEDQARSCGIAVDRLRMLVLLRISVLAAVAVAFVGTIGFIGLVGPHIARLALGEDHRFYLPGALLAGALVMSLASIASKTLVPGLVLPVGIVTALVGIPLFMALVFGQRRRS